MDFTPNIYPNYGFFPKDISTTLVNIRFKKSLNIVVGSSGFDESNFKENTDLIIIDYSHHPRAHGTLFNKYKNTPVLGLTGFYDANTDKIPTGSIYMYYPHYFGYANFEIPVVDTSNDFEKKYKFSCLNRSPKSERVWFYTKLFRQSFFENCITSFYNEFPNGDGIDFSNLDQDTINFFNQNIKHLLPICKDYDDLWSKSELDLLYSKKYNDSIHHKHPAINDSYIQIISEHSHTDKFLTEKTVKALAAKQIFLMAGPQYAIKELKRLGFDVFEDIICHDHYDSEPDAKIRLTKMLEIANDLDKQNLSKIYQETFDRRLRNQQYIYSEELRSKIFKPIIDFINTNCLQ